jgi:hypothetical protein
MLLALWQAAQIVRIAAIALQAAMVGMRSIDSRDDVVLPTMMSFRAANLRLAPVS